MPTDTFQREIKVSCLSLSKNLTHQQTTCSRIPKNAAVCFSASRQIWWHRVRAILSHRLVNYIYNNFERAEMKLSKEQTPWRKFDSRHQFICWEFSVWPWYDFLQKLYKNFSIICICVWIWASSCRRKATGESGDLQLNPLLQPSHWFYNAFPPLKRLKQSWLWIVNFISRKALDHDHEEWGWPLKAALAQQTRVPPPRLDSKLDWKSAAKE